MKEKKLIFGLGTGRCGTYSLTKVIQNQGDAYAFHELNFLPHTVDVDMLNENISSMSSRKESLVADVGFYYLNYVPTIVRRFPDAKFICLKRDKEEVIKSWSNHSNKINHWTNPNSTYWKEGEITTNTSTFFPKYNMPKEVAIGMFWEQYYNLADIYELVFPKVFNVFDMEYSLNDGQGELLDFIDIPEKDRVYTSERWNELGNPLIEHERMPAKLGTCEFCLQSDCAEWYVSDKKNGFMSYACSECKDNKKLNRLNI